jgi:hypothetical protein
MTLAFLGAVLALALLTIMPGPDIAIVTRVVLAHGKTAAFRTALGIATGLLFWGFLTVIGLSALARCVTRSLCGGQTRWRCVLDLAGHKDDLAQPAICSE